MKSILEVYLTKYNQFLRISIKHFKGRSQAHTQYVCIDKGINKA